MSNLTQLSETIFLLFVLDILFSAKMLCYIAVGIKLKDMVTWLIVNYDCDDALCIYHFWVKPLLKSSQLDKISVPQAIIDEAAIVAACCRKNLHPDMSTKIRRRRRNFRIGKIFRCCQICFFFNKPFLHRFLKVIACSKKSNERCIL